MLTHSLLRFTEPTCLFWLSKPPFLSSRRNFYMLCCLQCSDSCVLLFTSHLYWYINKKWIFCPICIFKGSKCCDQNWCYHCDVHYRLTRDLCFKFLAFVGRLQFELDILFLFLHYTSNVSTCGAVTQWSHQFWSQNICCHFKNTCSFPNV